jgi:hypothetical protein
VRFTTTRRQRASRHLPNTPRLILAGTSTCVRRLHFLWIERVIPCESTTSATREYLTRLGGAVHCRFFSSSPSRLRAHLWFLRTRGPSAESKRGAFLVSSTCTICGIKTFLASSELSLVTMCPATDFHTLPATQGQVGQRACGFGCDT